MLLGMEARLDSLRHLAAVADSAAFRSAATDTVVIGGFRIATSAALRPVVEVATGTAWDNLVARFGASIEAAGHLPVLQFGGPATVIPRAVDRRELARGLEGAAAQAIWRQQDSPLVTWLRGSFPVGATSVGLLLHIVDGIARTPAAPNPACLQGDTAACALALGLRLSADTLEEWYPPATWPRLAAMVEAPPSGREAWLQDRCVSAQDSVACRAVLVPTRLFPPVGAAGRQLLVELALDSGGHGAFERLTADSELTMERRLEVAARVPADTLLMWWAVAVRSAVPGSPAPHGGEFVLTLAWSAAVLAMALRGSRWR